MVVLSLKMVWSDSEPLLRELQPVLEYLESCAKRNVTDVLNKVESSFCEVSGKKEEMFLFGKGFHVATPRSDPSAKNVCLRPRPGFFPCSKRKNFNSMTASQSHLFH